MRINRLDLFRYGKFTDRSISLPQSDQDFHLIIGPNEAGKSTIRSAILDLFFGIEKYSTYSFLHEYPEMKLGALIQQENNSLYFQRTKATKQPLLDADGAPLSYEVLRQFLGATDRGYFDQMFGLNHEKLVTGGNEILNASNDIGQILFQTAAGIDGLGETRNALEAEADKLWSSRKSKDRAYYTALDEFNDAKDELKRVTVRTKEWVAAQTSVKQLEETLEQSKVAYRDLEVQRACIERVRRIAPTLNVLQEKEVTLDKLGKVIILPADAEKQFNQMAQELSNANHEYAVYKDHAETIQNRLASIHPDENLLKYVAEIQALAEQQPLIRNHEIEIIKRQQAVNSYQQQIKTLVRQLNWSVANEQKLARRLPTLPVRSTIASLLKRYDSLQHAFLSSQQAVEDKTKEIGSLDKQIASLSATSISAALRVALTAAQNLGNVGAQSKQLENQVSKANQGLKAAQAGLGQWNLDMNGLCHLILPTTAFIASFQERLTKSESAVSKLSAQLEEITETIHAKEFEITQYRKTHDAVTSAEVMTAREARDAIWSSIKSGAVSLQETATAYESKVEHADANADKRYDKAQEASTLQSKLLNLEELQQKKALLQARIVTNHDTLQAVQQAWLAAIHEMKLPVIPLHDIDSWLQAREKVIIAWDHVVAANQALARLAQEEAEAKETLLNCLNEGEVKVDAAMDLSALIIVATDVIESAVKTRARHDELTKQRDTAVTAMMALKEKAAAAQVESEKWQLTWQENLDLAGIKCDTEISAVEGMLSLFNEIDEKLSGIEELRTMQIEPMQMELDNFEKEVTGLMMGLAPELKGQSSSSIVKEWLVRLENAKSEKKEQERLTQEQIDLEQKRDEVLIRIDKAKCEIQTLRQLAKVTTNEALQDAIKRSDNWQNLNDAIIVLNKELADSGDGLTRAQLEAEFQSTNVSEISINRELLVQQQQDIQQQQNTISADLATSKAALARIAGQDDAIRAESKRQEALAKMAEVATRYIKVTTARTLLQWAINRYRETKQGPMLSRTNSIFSGLTLGSFQKLVVDFDTQPLALKGQRADGKMVNISGMSDGTRDQLYLALRLAAMELHFEQSQSLPFIADDLFVNFDDARAQAGLNALVNLSKKTQIIFLSHHDHLVSIVQAVFGKQVNIVRL